MLPSRFLKLFKETLERELKGCTQIILNKRQKKKKGKERRKTEREKEIIEKNGAYGFDPELTEFKYIEISDDDERCGITKVLQLRVKEATRVL